MNWSSDILNFEPEPCRRMLCTAGLTSIAACFLHLFQLSCLAPSRAPLRRPGHSGRSRTQEHLNHTKLFDRTLMLPVSRQGNTSRIPSSNLLYIGLYIGIMEKKMEITIMGLYIYMIERPLGIICRVYFFV